jgi:hypothetical protein
VEEAERGLWTLVVVNGDHRCVNRGQRKFASSSWKHWLDPVVSHHLMVMKKTKPWDVVDLLCVLFAEKISYKVAQLWVQRLVVGDIGTQRNSFQLLPRFLGFMETKDLGVHCDLVRDHHGKCLPSLLLSFPC